MGIKAKRSKLAVQYQEIFSKEVLPYLRRRFPRDSYTEPVWYYTQGIPRNMFRSVIPLCLAKIFNKDKKLVLPVVAASEIIFSISLVQDDIIDGDAQRQGFISAWKKFGLPVSVASIDYCYHYAYKILTEIEKLPIPKKRVKLIYNIFLESQKMLNESFLYEKLNKLNFKASTKDMLKLNENKTITGINAQYCSILALNVPLEECTKLRKYALMLAYAGQIKNDIMDFHKIDGYSEYRKYSDFKRGYMNYPIAKLYKKASEKDRILLKRNLGKSRPSNIHEVLKLLEKYDIAKESMDDCRRFVSEAKRSIAGFRECKEKIMLLDWADSHVKFLRAKNVDI